MRRRAAVVAGVVALALGGVAARAEIMAIQGTWVLDAKASKDVPDQMKMIDLKITLKGMELTTQRQFEGANVGPPFVVVIDGVAREREIAPGQRGSVQAQWKAGGKLLEQVVKTKASNLIDVTQTTLITVSEDGKVMNRVQTTMQAGDASERVYLYRKKQ